MNLLQFRKQVRSVLTMCKPSFVLGAVVLLLMTGGSRAETPLGSAPAFSKRELTPIPNAQAVTRRIWVPGIDEGYVPQGLTYIYGKLFISSYQSIDRNQSTGACRLYRIDPASGATIGQLDLPKPCGHAGGIAKGRPGHIVVSDTRTVFEIELADGADSIGRIVRSVRLSGAVKGSFAAGAADGLWLGAYERNPGAQIFKFSWNALEKPILSEVDAAAAIPLPLFAQGAAFDPQGGLWVMRSGSKFGELVKLDVRNGAIAARFDMPIGAEDISFEADGILWTLSEAGSKRWSEWAAFHPLVLRFDLNLLK